MPETEAGDRADALEMVRCAQINLGNLKTAMPDTALSVFYAVVETQLEWAAEAIEKDRRDDLTATIPLERQHKKAWFDGAAFYNALDAARQAKRLNWKQVAAESGVTASTLTRMRTGTHPSVNGLAALSAWSGLKINDFVRSDK